MAVAEYFERTAMAASQILSGYDYEGFVKLLNGHRIGLQLDAAGAKSAEGTASADLVVRLIARFYPKISIVPLGEGARPKAEELTRLALAVNPAISVTSTLDSVTNCIAIGNTPVTLKKKRGKIIYIGSANWMVRLSLKKPVGSGASKNPFAAGAAACLAVANLFRVVFAKQLPDSNLDGDVSFSLATLCAAASKNPFPYKPVDIGRTFLVGAGAIGNGALWAFGRSHMTGELNVVDPQRLELSNMQRYVMAVSDDVEKCKVTLATKWLASAKSLTVVPQNRTWDEFAHKSDWQFERVLVGLDTADDRIGVQASLPKWIANAYTLGSQIGVTRHHFLGTSACLACVYLPNGTRPSEDVLVASALGLKTTPPEIMEVRRRLDRNERCDRAFLKIIAERKCVALDGLLRFEDRPLRDLYQHGVCAGQVLGVQADAQETRAEVPMAFQSAMAGVFLAAELALDLSGLRDATFPTITRYDLQQPISDLYSAPRLKDSQRRCLCQDDDYIARYSEKYGPLNV